MNVLDGDSAKNALPFKASIVFSTPCIASVLYSPCRASASPADISPSHCALKTQVPELALSTDNVDIYYPHGRPRELRTVPASTAGRPQLRRHRRGAGPPKPTVPGSGRDTSPGRPRTVRRTVLTGKQTHILGCRRTRSRTRKCEGNSTSLPRGRSTTTLVDCI